MSDELFHNENIPMSFDGLGELDAPDGIKIAVGQFAPTRDTSTNLADITEIVRAAAENGAVMIVLPEYASSSAAELGDWTEAASQVMPGEFVSAISELANQHEIVIVVGFLETSDNPADLRPYNTVFAVAPGRGVVARYRKLHLYDAFSAEESKWIQPGDATEVPQLFTVADLTVGIQTCYDLRFPEVTRRLVDAGATLIALPAQWIAGPKKAHHWVALTAARAIENMVYVAAANQIAPVAVGMSRIISPMGETLIDMGQSMGVSIAVVQPEAVAESRTLNPSLDARRFDISPRA